MPGQVFSELCTGECCAIHASSHKVAFSVRTVLGFTSLLCFLTCRKMTQMNMLDTANEELNADDQPDKDWLHLDMQQLEEKLRGLQRTLRACVARLEDSSKLRLLIARLEGFIEQRRELGSKQWLSQVRVAATWGWRLHRLLLAWTWLGMPLQATAVKHLTQRS